jgi:2-C-methyl-D-erythritol 4-phosphate cytidylyltransferase
MPGPDVPTPRRVRPDRGASVWAVVVAGGSGTRFGRPKQFSLLAGRPVAEWSVAACRPTAGGVVLVVPDGYLGRDHGADVVVTGGSTRSASVRCGLAAVPPSAEVVLVHDAARPLAPPSLFRSVVQALDDLSVAGAVCALPVADTLKRVDGSLETITGTVNRDGLMAVQTPQAFRADVLRRAHAAGDDATDDAALVEALGATVRVVPGDPRNIKLTTPADLAVAERLLEG